MLILQQVQRAIDILHRGSSYIDPKNLVIAFSPLIQRYIEQELYENQMMSLSNDNELKSLMGIKVFNEWPFNEIVIYDKINSCYYPERIMRIVFKQETKVIFSLTDKIIEGNV